MAEMSITGDVHAGDLVFVPLRKGQHFLEGGVGLGGEGGVDIDLVGGGCLLYTSRCV